jgi:membrane protease YdiL (CAAX protease family)
VFAPLIGSQLFRLAQTDRLAWLAWDYAGRMAALALLHALPSAREVAFANEPRRTEWLATLGWVLALVALYRLVHVWIKPGVEMLVPGTKLGLYPDIRGMLRLFDTTLGLLLVAFSEETVFRRCARAVLRPHLGDGWAMVFVSALLFGSYHWWTGLPNIAAAFLFGVLAMLFYRRCAALWPVVVAHYLVDFDMFA